MSSCCGIKPPVDMKLFMRAKRKYKVQRKKTLAEGTPNARNELDYKDDANWTTVGERWVMVDTRSGRQTDIVEVQIEVTSARGFSRWDAVTGAIDSTYRLVRGTGTTRKVWQVVSGRNWMELDEWVQLTLAEFN